MIHRWHGSPSWLGVKMRSCVSSKWIIRSGKSITMRRDRNAPVWRNHRWVSFDLSDRVLAKQRWISFRMKLAIVTKVISKRRQCTIYWHHRGFSVCNHQIHPMRTTTPLPPSPNVRSRRQRQCRSKANWMLSLISTVPTSMWRSKMNNVVFVFFVVCIHWITPDHFVSIFFSLGIIRWLRNYSSVSKS